MNVIKQTINLLFGKHPKSLEPIEAIVPAEMDRLYGGKPAEAISSQAYWWIEDEPLPTDATVGLSAKSI